MKGHRDKQRVTPNAIRQAKFADTQRALGRKARKIWATDSEAEALRLYLEEIRTAHGGGHDPASA
jgi:hypothetical protein